VCNLKEKGDSSDDTCANVFIHKDDDIPNSQYVLVELIVSDDYFSQEENLNLPSEVQSNAYFKQVNKDVDGKKVAGGGKKPTGRGKSLLLGVTRVLVKVTSMPVGVRGLTIIF